MEGDWKFLGGRAILKVNFLEEMYENKPGFPGGRGEGGAKQKTFCWGSMDIFWNCTKEKKKKQKEKEKIDRVVNFLSHFQFLYTCL